MQQRGGSGGIDPGADEVGYLFAVAVPGAAQAVTTLTNIMIIVMGWWSMILEVFLRYQFGERYLSLIRAFCAGLILFIIDRATQYWAIPLGNNNFSTTVVNPFAFRHNPLWPFFLIAFVLLTANHLIRIWLRNRLEVSWHSRSFGISWFEDIPLPGGDWALYRFYEPALCFVVFLIVGYFDNMISFVLGVGTAALFLKNNLVYFQYRAITLDLADARIESEYYNAAVAGKPKAETAGLSVVSVVMPKAPTAPYSMDDIDKTVQEAQTKPPPPPAPTSNDSDDMDFSDTINEVLKPKDKD